MRNPDVDKLTKEDKIELSKMCYRDTKKAAKILYPNRFYRDFDSEHDKIFDLLDNSDNPRKVIAAPRGTGKTSIMNLLIPTKRLAFMDSRFIVPVSSTGYAAEQQSENLKNEFMNNSRLKSIFNIQKTRNFSKKQWVIEMAGGEKSMVWPKGAGHQVRGMLFHDYRPDLVIVDDLENDENLRSELQRKQLKEWFYGPLINIVDRGTTGWEIIYIDTLKHEDSLLQDLLDSSYWDSVVLEMCDDDYETKFPNMMSTPEVKDLAEQYREKGQIDVFYREYRNLPVATDDKPFTQEFFQYYTNKYNVPEFKKVDFRDQSKFITVIVIDPAKTAKMNNAESALVGGSINIDTGELYYRDIVNGHWHPDELYREMNEMITRLRPEVVGVEVTGVNEFATYPIQTELRKNSPGVQLVELHARGGTREDGKTTRVRSLVSFYRKGLVWHNHRCSGGLESQLLSFPRSKRWDIMDAAAYFVELFEKGQKYASSRQDDIPSQQEIEDEWEELGYTESEKSNPLVIRGI